MRAVRAPPRHVLHMPGIHHTGPHPSRFQDLGYRNPVHAVDSIATVVMPQAANQSANSFRSAVSKTRTGCSSDPAARPRTSRGRRYRCLPHSARASAGSRCSSVLLAGPLFSVAVFQLSLRLTFLASVGDGSLSDHPLVLSLAGNLCFGHSRCTPGSRQRPNAHKKRHSLDRNQPCHSVSVVATVWRADLGIMLSNGLEAPAFTRHQILNRCSLRGFRVCPRRALLLKGGCGQAWPPHKSRLTAI